MAYYRVPTGTEVQSFVNCINLAVKVGHRVTYAQSGAEWRVASARVLDVGNLLVEVVTWCGLPLPSRDAALFSVDSFCVDVSPPRRFEMMVPCWLERGTL